MSDTLKRPIDEETSELAIKKIHVEDSNVPEDTHLKGVAILKPEYIVNDKELIDFDDDAAENAPSKEDSSEPKNRNDKKQRGQNKARKLVQAKDEIKLCPSIIDLESGKKCIKGSECNWSHDLNTYLEKKSPDLEGLCPVWEELGWCPMGVKCRWLKSHFNPIDKTLKYKENYIRDENRDEINLISMDDKRLLYKRKFDFEKSEIVIKLADSDKLNKMNIEKRKDLENKYKEFKIKSGEKRKIDYKNKKILSPLTTVGNLPYRRLMKTLGADITFSEMALSSSLIQGQNSEWALLKAHKSEIPGFGIQIAASKTWQASKSCEVISKFIKNDNIHEINLNCGCPIDLLFKKGEGSGLMNNPNRMKSLLKVMNDCSNDIPITVKMRMGVKDNKPIAIDIIKKLLSNKNDCNISAITIHGRSRQQRYTKEANWNYIEEAGKVVKEFNENFEDEKDVSDPVNPIYLIGNGDCYNFEDWYEHNSKDGIDSVMIARGALIKPWIFEEIESQQYLDKSANERLEILKKYSDFALQHWGTDDFGINTSRRFLCEFLSFTYRYIPIGILDKLPAKLNQRPPKWKGRNELETLMGSDDYKDWIKITEMFLGKANEGFTFIPKHKSNAYQTPRD